MKTGINLNEECKSLEETKEPLKDQACKIKAVNRNTLC